MRKPLFLFISRLLMVFRAPPMSLNIPTGGNVSIPPFVPRLQAEVFGKIEWVLYGLTQDYNDVF